MFALFLLFGSLLKILLKGFVNFLETIFHDLSKVFIPVRLSLRFEPLFKSFTLLVLFTIPSIMGCMSPSMFLTEVTEFFCASFLRNALLPEGDTAFSVLFQDSSLIFSSLFSPEPLALGFLLDLPFSMISSVTRRLRMSCRIIP